MKQVKKIVCALLLAALVFSIPTAAAFAAESGSLWLSTTETSDSTTVLIATDTTVTDGVIEVTYDSSVLTYQNVTVNETYVAMYSVNADTLGSVKISWVAPEAYESDGTGIELIQVNFSGTEKKSTVALNSSVNNAAGNDVPTTNGPDTTELEKAILEAEGLSEYLYSKKTYADVKEALAAAHKVLESPVSSQKDVNDAANALRIAMDNLELRETASNGDVDTSELEKAIAKAEGLNKDMYTKKSYNVVASELKDAKAVLSDHNATQKEVDDAAKSLNDAIAALELLSEKNNPSTGAESMMSTMIILAVLSVAVISIMGIKFMRRRA